MIFLGSSIYLRVEVSRKGYNEMLPSPLAIAIVLSAIAANEPGSSTLIWECNFIWIMEAKGIKNKNKVWKKKEKQKTKQTKKNEIFGL